MERSAPSVCRPCSMAAPYVADVRGRFTLMSREVSMPSEPAKPQAALDALVSLLDLEPLEQNLFRGRSPKQGWQRVYGGQVLGQALVAAVRTVEPDRICHSMHAYFL